MAQIKRDKRRFGSLFHSRRWVKKYWYEYHAAMWRCGNDGYYKLLTTDEHLTFWKQHHRETVQKINGICGKPIKRLV